MSGFELGVREMVISKDTSGFSMNVMRGKFERQESITDMTSSRVCHFSLLLPSTLNPPLSGHLDIGGCP